MQTLPTFTTPQRLHPRTLVYRFLNSLPYFALLIVSLVRNPATTQWVGVVFALAAGLLTLPWILLSYLRFRYQITPKEVTIEKGVLTREHRSIPLERIQNIEIQQSVVQRWLGLARVRLETAGGAGSEGVLQFVSPETAQLVRQVIRTYQREQDHGAVATVPGDPTSAGAEPGAPGTAQEAGDEHALLSASSYAHRMPLSEVILCGAFRFSLVYIAVFFSALQYLNIQPEDLVDWLLGPSFERLMVTATVPPWLVFLVGILVATLLAWLTSILTTLNRYYGFRLWLEEGKLYKKHGLLTVSEGTIPLRRMQLLRLRSNVLMRHFDRYELRLQTMGVDPRQQGSQVVLPLGTKGRALDAAGHLYAFALPDTFQRVSPRTIRRACVRYTMAVVALDAPAVYFWSPTALWALGILPLLYGLAVLQYRLHGYALQDDDTLFVRRGFWQHRIWIIPIKKIQLFYTTASVFQRRLGLKTLHIDTAGASRLNAPRLVDLDDETTGALLNTLYGRFQHQFDRRREPAPHRASAGLTGPAHD